MSWFFQLFDLFNAAAKTLALYIPQSGSDVIELFKKLLGIANSLSAWIDQTVGLDIKGLLLGFGKAIIMLFGFVYEVLKQLVDKLS
jgi:hypothetical protein